MLIGQTDYPIEESVLFILLIIVLVFNIYLFNRAHQSYTIKYELMKKHRLFRVNQLMTHIVDFIYKAFFALPFIIIFAITVLRGIKNVVQFPPILVNGLVVVLIIYPSHRDLYYVKYGCIWLLAIVSQFLSQLLTDANPDASSSYIQISFIFYTANSMVFCLALLFKENIYWDIEDAIKLSNPEQIIKVNKTWTQHTKLPNIFHGGIYGWMCKHSSSFNIFLTIYLFSLAILGVYAFVIYAIEKSFLGITGLITCFIYDIFILIFSSLKSSERSVKNLFFMIYLGRFLSFIFGQNFWLFGYCILYFLVGIYVGNMIIDKHYPLRVQKKASNSKKRLNAFTTPQFLLVLLTIQTIILIIVQQISGVVQVFSIQFNKQQIAVWQFAILIVLATWVIILYLLSGRLLTRHIKKIRSFVSYYFGFSFFNEYHIYMVLTYFLILGGGLYCYFYLFDKNIFLACIFLPLIYIFVFELGAYWVKNHYAVLADTDEFNKKEQKKFEMKKKKNKMKNKLQKDSSKVKDDSKDFQNVRIMIQNIKFNVDDSDTENQIQSKKVINSKQTFNNVQQTHQQHKTPQKKEKLNNTGDQKMDEEESQQSNKAMQFSEQTSEGNFLQMLQNKIKKETTSGQTQEKYIPLKNWRQQDLSCLQKWDNLTNNDRTILISGLIILLTLILYSLVASLWANTISGVAFSLSIVSFLTTFVYYKIVQTGNEFNAGQIIVGIIGFLLGLIFWAFYYEIAFGGIVWAVVSVLLYLNTLQIGSNRDMPLSLVIILIGKVLLLLGFICVLLGATYGIAIGIVVLAIIIAACLGFLNYYHFQKNKHIPIILKYLSGIMIFILLFGLTVAGFVLDILSDFSVFTIVMLVIVLALFLVYIFLSYSKNLTQYIHPHIYSSYGLTIYKFESQNQKLKTSTNHVVIFNVAMVLLIVYSAITTLFFKQKYLAIYALSIFLICQFTELICRSIETYYFFGQNRKNLTQKIVNDALKMLTQKYMANEIQGDDSPQFIKQFQKIKEQAQQATTEEELNIKWKQTVVSKQLVLINLQEQQKFLFFWLALIRFYLYSQRQNKMNEFIILMEQIKESLAEKDIVIEALDSASPLQIKYKLLQKQIQSLTAFDIVEVQKLQEQQRKKNKQKGKLLEVAHKKSLQAEQQKEIELFKKNQEIIKKTLKKQSKHQQPINLLQKFKQTMKASKQKKQLFVDSEFPITDETIIGQKLKSKVSKWRRPNIGEKFISGTGMSPDDVKQGNIGDCYLISSFAVLGQKFLKKCIGINEDQTEIWKNQKGAYMVKFFKFSQQIYVVVDDFLPVDSNEKRVFATSQDSIQFWPGILEKAYAKLYGGYGNIISGKCHQVLSQFTGGFPFEILLAEQKKNINALWNRMLNSKNNGYLLAAGSPENQKGDTVASKRGIVQGHAYSILDVVQIAKKYKLIKLKNPHGSGGFQWNGAFSDESEYMDNNTKKLLGHQTKDDGIFWMKLQDFVVQFKSLYICCIFQEGWKKLSEIQGQWKPKENSFGRPEKSDHAHKNIQLGLKVHKKCTFFISLSQQHKSALYGKNHVLLRIQQNDGKRMKKNDICSDKLCGASTKPINAVTISQQIQLQNAQYPYTYTIYVSAQLVDQNGVALEGQGRFKLQMFCNDQQATIIKHQDFDRETLNQ